MAKRLLNTQRIVNLASDPASGTTGEIYYNTNTNSFKYYNGTSWISLSSGGGSGNSFETINTPNGTDPVADSSTDTLNITESNGIIVTGNSTTDTIDISTNATSLNTASTIISRDSSQSFDITGIDFDTTDTISAAVGRLSWDDGEGTLTLGLKGGNANLQLGQENVTLCYNGTNSTITNGSVIYIVSAQGQRPSIALADADTELTSSKTFGVTTESITNGAEGFVTTFGVVNGIDTSGFSAGDALWLSSTAGQLTATKPSAPTHAVFVGYCLHSHASSGRIFVNPQNGYEVDELHNVLITSIADNHILSYDNATSLWKNQGLAAAIQEVDGSGSNIDSDQLDGQEGTYYLDWANTTNKPDPTITLNGDLSGSITLTDLTGGILTATIVADAVALGTDTTGNYVASVSGTDGVSISGTGESASVTIANSDKGSSQNIFKNVSVSGQSDIVADSNNDTLTFAGGTGITLTTNATTDTLTVTNSGVTALAGTTNQIAVSSSTGSSTISLPSAVVFPGTVTLNADPTQALQAATKQYVDAVAQGLHIHASAQTATTANIANFSSPGASIDGVTLTNNMRVLVKNQNTTSQNGVYVYSSSTGALTRASDFDTAPEIHGGDFIFVTGGTTNNDTGWVQTETVTTVGTDPILFQQFSGAGTYTAGNGLTLTGTVFSINTGITADLSTIQTLTNKTINGANNTLTVRLANDISGFGTNVASALANNVGAAGAFVTFNGALGTPSSATLTNATGLPVSSGISGLGTGIATFLATPTSANLLAAVTDETGTGSLVFANSPTFTTPNIGVATGTSFNSITGLSSTTPIVDGTAAAGTSTTVARADHVHPTDTSRAATSGTLAQFGATTSAQLAGVISDETGSGALVFATSPSLTTPSLGIASATSINKVAITAPATSATLTIADGKTLTASNTLTFTGTDSSSVAFGSGGTVVYTSGATFTGNVIFNGVLDASELRETVVDVTLSTNTATLDWTAGNVYYIATAPTGAMTFNVTNAPTDNSKMLNVTVFVTQGATGYIPSTFQIGGVGQTIKWVGGSAPTPTSSAGKIDVFSFTLQRTSGGAWIVYATSTLNF